jgi:hypothetical protein
MTDDHAAELHMLTNARQAVLASADWLTAAEVAQRASGSPTDVAISAERWQREGRLFAIRPGEVDYFPGYGFDPRDGYCPTKAMCEVLATFACSRDGWGLAYWFASVNSYLGGQRPQDLIATDPERVVAAAKVEMEGVIHG